MTLSLDDRQRAMLAEMGIRLFEALPLAAPAADERLSSPDSAKRAALQGGSVPPPPPPGAAASAVSALPPGPGPDRAPAPVALMPLGERPAGVDTLDWDALTETVASCQACGLCRGRRNTVFGVGNRQADWMVIGETPSEGEDLQGEPFVGATGQLLGGMLRSIGLDRERVYIANVIKCRPPGNRNPEPAEVAQCEPFLRRQVALVQPRIILAMGRLAVQALLATQEPIGKLRGRVHRYQGVPVVATYHPAYLLRNLPDKAKAWADLCLALDQTPPQP